MKIYLTCLILHIFSFSVAQQESDILTFSNLDPEYRYTFGELAGRTPLKIPYPQFKHSPGIEVHLAFSIRPDGWVEQVRLISPVELASGKRKKIIRTVKKWKFSPQAGKYNHPTQVGIWFYHDKLPHSREWAKEIAELAEGLGDRSLIYAPMPLPANIQDTVKVELEINPRGEFVRLISLSPVTPTYRAVELLLHRAIQAVQIWKFEPINAVSNQRITLLIPIKKAEK